MAGGNRPASGEPAVLDYDGITISGSGRLIGAMLVQETPEFDGARILKTKIASAYNNGYPPDFLIASVDAQGRPLFPAGVYRLYVLADGSTVTATLRLRGLPSGAAMFAPAALSGYQLRDVPVRATSQPGVLAGAANGSLARTGALIRMLKISGAGECTGTVDLCLWINRTAPPEASTQPGCPGGAPTYGAHPVHGPVPSLGMSTLVAPDVDWAEPAGTYGQGAYAVTNSPNVTVKSLAVWLPL